MLPPPSITNIVMLWGAANTPAVAVYNPANGIPFVVSTSHVGVGNLLTAKTTNGQTVPVSPISVPYTDQSGSPATRLESQYPMYTPEFNQPEIPGFPGSVSDIRFQLSLVPFYSSSFIFNPIPDNEIQNCTMWVYFFQRSTWSWAVSGANTNSIVSLAFQEAVLGGDSSSPVWAVNNTTGVVYYLGSLAALHPNGYNGLIHRIYFDNVPQPTMPAGYPASYPYPVPIPSTGVMPNGTQVVTGPVNGSAYSDPPRIWATMVGGGYQCRANVADRNGINANARIHGMQVFVMDTQITYRLNSDLTTWTTLAI